MNSSLQTFSQHHGLFSSQTAFKRPNLSTKVVEFSSKSSPLQNFNQIPEQQTTSCFGKRKNCSLKNLEPKKKIKLNSDTRDGAVHELKGMKSQLDYSKSAKLTIDEVFNKKSKETQQKAYNNMDFFDEDCDSSSSLSFLSSDISFDDLEEESIQIDQSRKFEEGFSLNIQAEARSSMEVPLISYPNNTASHINSLHFLQYLICLEQQKNQLQFQTSHWQQNQTNEILSSYLRMNQLNDSLHQLQFSLFENSSSLFSNQMDFYPQISLKENPIFNTPYQENGHVFNQSNKDKYSFFEEDYDSDSKGTKSTNDDLDNNNMSPGGNFFKSFSPIESISGEEIELNVGIPNFGKNKKPSVKKTSSKQTKEKKKEALKLKMDINPKNFISYRRQNKLQLLRKGQDNKDTDEPVEKDEIEIESEVRKNGEENLRATIPELGVRERRRPQVKTVWNPNVVKSKEIADFLERVRKLLEEEIINEEAALKFLTSNHVQVQKTFEIIEANPIEFKEKFRIKARRERRARFGF